jgi:diacylglycerol kinase (ATP)
MKAFLASFSYALAGLGYLLRTQRNARIHVVLGTCALTLGTLLRLDRIEWMVLIIACTLVLAAEGVNTAIEAAVDTATSTYHPMARAAKDVAAGTVLLCAIAAVVLGGIIFLPHLWPKLEAFLR